MAQVDAQDRDLIPEAPGHREHGAVAAQDHHQVVGRRGVEGPGVVGLTGPERRPVEGHREAAALEPRGELVGGLDGLAATRLGHHGDAAEVGHELPAR